MTSELAGAFDVLSNAPAAQEDKITIRHLITMSSGLTVVLKHEKEPGTKWFYNTAAYGMLLRAVAAASGMNNNELTGAWLTDRIGMGDSSWQPRPWASDHPKANAVGFVTTARDLARFGLLIQAFDPVAAGESDLSIRADRVHVSSRITSTLSFPGQVDDALIYNRVLSYAEIAGLAGQTASFDKPF